MTTYLAIRSGASGPALVGTVQNQVPLWDVTNQKWYVGTAPGGGAVDSVFGRTGVVVAVTGDYDSDQVDNVSGVTGSSVSDALDFLLANAGAVASVFGRTGVVAAVAGDYDSDQVDNVSGVTGSSVSDALDALDADIGALSAAQVSNNGTNVPGSTVQAALDNLKSGAANDVNTVAGTSYQFVLADAGKYLRFTNGAPVPVTVPTNTTVAFPIGTQISGVQGGAGQVQFVPEDGTVTINTAETLKTRFQQSGWSLKKYATNAWDLVGDLELA